MTGLLISLWVSVWNYYIGLGLAKLSIVSIRKTALLLQKRILRIAQVIQCFRIFGHIRAFAIASYILASIIIAFTIFATLTSIFMCRPVPHFWHPMEEGGYCLPRLPLWCANFQTTSLALTDFKTQVLQLSLHNANRHRHNRSTNARHQISAHDETTKNHPDARFRPRRSDLRRLCDTVLRDLRDFRIA